MKVVELLTYEVSEVILTLALLQGAAINHIKIVDNNDNDDEEDEKDEDEMDDDEVSKIRDALAQKSAEKWIRGYIKSLRDGPKKDKTIISHL